jgi:NitT/TauT family transport system permease protein
MLERNSPALRSVLLPLALFILFLATWEAAVRVASIPVAILPAPTLIARTIGAEWRLLWEHTWLTTLQCIAGFLYAVIGGVGLGVLIASSRFFREGVYPLIVVLQLVPKVAVAPVLMFWFGLGATSRLLLAFLIAFFPMVINTFTGLVNTPEDMIRMGRAFKASGWQIFAKIRLPSALPYVFSGLKISITLAVIGIIVAEFVSAQAGLGYLIVYAEGIVDTPLMMAALTVLSAVGLVLYWLVYLLEKLVMRWDVPELE